MRTRAKRKYVASDRARRESFACETLYSNRKLRSYSSKKLAEKSYMCYTIYRTTKGRKN